MRVFVAAAAFALAAVGAATAQDPRPARPTPPAAEQLGDQPLRARPAQPAAPRGAAADLLEEDVELLTAHRETKKAYLNAAMVALEGAKTKYSRIAAHLAAGTATADEGDRAKLDVATAEALVQIRASELREVEVKLKYAGKRLENAKAPPPPPPGERPVERPAPRPKPEDPGAIDPRGKLAEIEAALEARRADVAKAEAEVNLAKAQLDRIRALAERGIIAPEELRLAEAKWKGAEAALKAAQAALKATEVEAAAAKVKPRPNPR